MKSRRLPFGRYRVVWESEGHGQAVEFLWNQAALDGAASVEFVWSRYVPFDVAFGE